MRKNKPGAGGKRPKIPVVGYKGGVFVGIKTTDEWADMLGLKYRTISIAKCEGRTTKTGYTFRDATWEEEATWRT